MSLKDKFAASEWAQLVDLPLQIFCFIAGADGEIDDEEFDTLKTQLRDAPFYKSALHRDLLLELVQCDDLQERFNRSHDRVAFVKMAPGLKATLQSKLSQADYELFIQSVFIEALKTANVTGPGNAGQGKHISREENFALDVLIGNFDIPWPPQAS